MESIDIKSYKISQKLNLREIEASFNMQKPSRWKDYVTFDKDQLDTILKYNTESRIAYLYNYGCVCFVNFTENEVYTFLQYIDSIVGGVDFNLYSKYNENHIEQFDAAGNISNGYEYTIILCNILAKSVELSKLEADLEGLLDKMDKLIVFLQSGRFHISKKLVSTVSKILQLEYHYANNIKICDRNINNSGNIESRSAFDRLSKYYELDDRLKVIQNKMDYMRNIISEYSSFSFNHRESKAYWVEIILLSLFPLSYLLELFLAHR